MGPDASELGKHTSPRVVYNPPTPPGPSAAQKPHISVILIWNGSRVPSSGVRGSKGTLLWLLLLSSRTFCAPFSASIPSSFPLPGLTDSSNYCCTRA